MVLQIMTPTWCYIPSGVLNNDEWWTKFTFFGIGPRMSVKIITSWCFSKWNHKEIIPNKIDFEKEVIWTHNSTKHYKLISIPYIRPIGQHIAIQIGYPICTLHFFRDRTDIYDYVFPISIPNCLSDRTQWMNRDWMSDL